MSCHHGITFYCHLCKVENQERDRREVREGRAAYAVLLWRADGRYTHQQAAQLYRSRHHAQKDADRRNEINPQGGGWVVRFVRLT